jgi:3',5'-cyclic AMP phosphodiesterase CpdA
MFAARTFRTVAGMKPAPDVVIVTGDLTETGSAAVWIGA